MRTLQFIFYLLTVILFIGCNSDLSKRMEILDIDKKWKNGNLIEAKEEINNYLNKNPNNEIGWTLLGHIESDSNKDSLALIAYKKALQLDPKTVEAITGLGILFRKKGNYNKAANYYYQAIKIDPNYAEAYSSLVVINLKKKNFKEAVRVGLKSYELDKENGTIAANLSVSYHYINDTIKRNKYFDIAKKNKYHNLESLRELFKGEYTIFD